ncbi:hypothetical protein [Legionella oakridgensis]|uniref:Uncharacterized protein n=2 Tax=Legionella oakridgensis TaxID=29423 RepID=W0BBT8_9GAMM|nr:hypothetical protein [Legionella oakridgensis]AHE67295.1 hypothetical protein Loa_01748 [Legionella oakridgensis ATCC 33761 = DSM 21215]ETO93047.1 hypothetical protein LOR_75c21460 [Legionella oakridgensis RV-2-2007]KTD37917.1 hypothetical protein Loak_1593 [Legionella oakridgensis]STY20361.1 Uncharacterised protein [Legionella longbeachae]
MPNPIDALPRDKKIIADKVIGGLQALKPYVDHYKERIGSFKEQLASAESSAAFIAVVRQIVRMEKELFNLKHQVMSGVDEGIVGALSEYIAGHADLMAVMGLFQYNEELTRSIRDTKQRLSEKELFGDLSSEQRAVLTTFIHDVLGLEKIVDVLKPIKERYQQRLQDADSHEEVDEIEQEIAANAAALAALYKQEVSYPEDEKTAAALIKYLEANRELLMVIKTLDGGFAESLDDDVLAARASIASAYSPRM